MGAATRDTVGGESRAVSPSRSIWCGLSARDTRGRRAIPPCADTFAIRECLTLRSCSCSARCPRD